VTLVLLTLVLIGNYAVKGPFWALSTEILSPATAASGIAAINTISHLGTGGATSVLGLIKDKTGSFPLSLLPLAALTAAGAITVLLLGRSQKRILESAAAAEAFPGSRRSSA
jgi:ACS family tartrate transporter-like MFS transporter